MKLAIRTLVIALVAIAVQTSAFAFTPIDKTVAKARQAVETASPDDWHAYAQAAKLCIDKEVNMKEAAQWIKRSVEIRETPFNLKVLGDYYAANRLPERALEAYSKSIRVGKLQNEQYADQEPNTIDGVKIDFEDGWVHLRKSNTEPIIRVYSEAGSEAEARRIGERFMKELKEAM